MIPVFLSITATKSYVVWGDSYSRQRESDGRRHSSWKRHKMHCDKPSGRLTLISVTRAHKNGGLE